MGGGEGEVVELGADEGKLWVRPRWRAVVREPPERRRGGRGGKAAVHRLQLLSAEVQNRIGLRLVSGCPVWLYQTQPSLVN